MFVNVPLTAVAYCPRRTIYIYTPVLFISQPASSYPSVSSCKRIVSGLHLMATGQKSLLYLRRLDVSCRCGCSHKLLFVLIKRNWVDTIGTFLVVCVNSLKTMIMRNTQSYATQQVFPLLLRDFAGHLVVTVVVFWKVYASIRCSICRSLFSNKKKPIKYNVVPLLKSYVWQNLCFVDGSSGDIFHNSRPTMCHSLGIY